MVIPILRNICQDLPAVAAARKARLCYDIYGSGKDPLPERMGWLFLTAFIIRNHLRTSGRSAKHVKPPVFRQAYRSREPRPSPCQSAFFSTETLPTLSMR
jgi:hypothetical protein